MIMIPTLLPVIILASLASIAIVVIFELAKTPTQEVAMIEREDEAMCKLPDDPREIARWVP